MVVGHGSFGPKGIASAIRLAQRAVDELYASVDVEAAIEGAENGDSGLLHYASDPDEPLLSPRSRAEALAWLDRSSVQLGGHSPRELLRTEEGARRVVELLAQIDDDERLHHLREPGRS